THPSCTLPKDLRSWVQPATYNVDPSGEIASVSPRSPSPAGPLYHARQSAAPDDVSKDTVTASRSCEGRRLPAHPVTYRRVPSGLTVMAVMSSSWGDRPRIDCHRRVPVMGSYATTM